MDERKNIEGATIRDGTSLYRELYDTAPSGRKYTRTITVNVDPDMYQAAQDLASHRALPFNGSLSGLAREALATRIESLRDYLAGVPRTLWVVLREEVQRATAESYILTIDNLLDMAADNLRRLTMARSWTGVYKSLEASARAVDEFPESEWKVLVARGWLEHPGVQALKRAWAQDMMQEDGASWQRVVEVFKRLEEAADG